MPQLAVSEIEVPQELRVVMCGLPMCDESPVETVTVSVLTTEYHGRENVPYEQWTKAQLQLCQEHYDRLGLLEDEAARGAN